MTELELQIPFSGIDPKGKMKFGVLLEMFQEMADVDASKFGLSVRQTLDNDITWVLRNYRVSLERYPCKDDRALKIKTWHEPYRKLFSLRSFRLWNAAGVYLGEASTWWVLLDVVKMRPMRLDRNDLYSFEAEKVLDEFPPEVKIPELATPQIEEMWKVRWQDLDVNDHTNHAVYFNWALDTVPFEVPELLSPMLVEGEFLHPVPRVCVKAQTEEVPNDTGREFLHSLRTEDGTLEYAKFHSLWR